MTTVTFDSGKFGKNLTLAVVVMLTMMINFVQVEAQQMASTCLNAVSSGITFNSVVSSDDTGVQAAKLRKRLGRVVRPVITVVEPNNTVLQSTDCGQHWQVLDANTAQTVVQTLRKNVAEQLNVQSNATLSTQKTPSDRIVANEANASSVQICPMR